MLPRTFEQRLSFVVLHSYRCCSPVNGRNVVPLYPLLQHGLCHSAGQACNRRSAIRLFVERATNEELGGTVRSAGCQGKFPGCPASHSGRGIRVSNRPRAISCTCGLPVSQFLTLSITPVFYLYLEKVRAKIDPAQYRWGRCRSRDERYRHNRKGEVCHGFRTGGTTGTNSRAG